MRYTLRHDRKRMPTRQAHLAVALAAWLATVGSGQVAAQQPTIATDRPDSLLTLVINIPAFRVDVWQGGRIGHSFTVAVGMRRYPTPTGEFLVSRLTWNPWWYPPDSPWAANDTVTPPGPRNPMGRAKLDLGSAYFMHGTPTVNSLGKAASHGCIRMHNEDVTRLAILAERFHAGLPETAVPDSGSWDWGWTRTVVLTTPIPVRLEYELAEVRDSVLMVYPDVYRRASEGRVPYVIEALRRAGVDTTAISRDAIERLVQQSVSKPARLHLRDLKPPPAEGAAMQSHLPPAQPTIVMHDDTLENARRDVCDRPQ